MTNELAIHILTGDVLGTTEQTHEAVAMAVRALSQPEIIHCKDCKYSEHWHRDKCRCFLWAESGIGVFGDGFCNYAKRKEE